MAKLTFKTTDNKVLIVRLLVAEALGATEVEIKVDSQVVVNQVMEANAARGDRLKKYMNQV